MLSDSSNKDQVNIYVDDEDDELDLIKLVSTNANDSNQYVVFEGSDGDLYAKNVSKIEELLVYKDLMVAKNHDDNVIVGTADIRNKMTTVVSFDKWMGNKVLPDNEYELVIIANYGGHRFALVVKRVEHIVTIEPNEMTDNSDDNEKSTFITKVIIAGQEKLCTVFDSDKMLLDIYKDIDKNFNEITNNISIGTHSDRCVFFADDSRLIRNMLEKLAIKLNLNYKIFKDGKLLVDELFKTDPDEIGLVVTDMEMPVMAGREVINKIRENPEYDEINIVVYTNMSNLIMENELISSGATKIINKIDMLTLSEAIDELLR